VKEIPADIKIIEYENGDLKGVDHSLYLSEIDCATKNYYTLEISDYSPYGEPIRIYPAPFVEWKSIPPSSIIKGLFNEVCSEKNK
jgi:hypothetical protein